MSIRSRESRKAVKYVISDSDDTNSEEEISVKKELQLESLKRKRIKKEVETDDNDVDYKTQEERSNKKVKVEHASQIIKKDFSPLHGELFKSTICYDEYKTPKEEPGSSKIKTEHFWKDHQLLAEFQNIEECVAKNLVNLFEEGNTIPFIARYRRNLVNNMSPEDLRDVKDVYDKINALKDKCNSIIKSLEKNGHLNETIKNTILSSKSIEEIEHIYAPFKPGSKKTLVERAKALGLEEGSLALLNNTSDVNLYSFINKEIEGLQSIAEIEKGVVHIIAHYMATDTHVLTFLRQLRPNINFMLESKKNKRKTETKVKTKKTENVKNIDESKFENYFDFKIPVKYIKHHQVLAINRAETHKILTVKIIMPEFVFHQFSKCCYDLWIKVGKFNEKRKQILEESVKDSFTRLVQPLIIREVRAELKLKAEKASYDVFSKNLKQLLLLAPTKGCPILGIDPGFTNGCKLALISETGNLLSSDVIYPHKSEVKKREYENILRKLLLNHDCNLIALGNGTACRETESWISELIAKKIFTPLDVKYTIVNENGASIYSCSPEAKKEFPTLDPNIISALSLARRIQEPLAELVKVEPKHLGVGMYQHDLPKKKLEEALEEVVSECVSFVGVDLNTTSQCLLRKIAGLTNKRATDIIEYRTKIGRFSSRKEILKVKGIGTKIFEQCAGFLRVGPVNSNETEDFYKNSATNKLDCTEIHPESYDVTEKLLEKLKLSTKDIGQLNFINSAKQQISLLNIRELSNVYNVSKETLKLILDALIKPLNHDMRNEISQVPLFKKGLVNISDLKQGSILTGRVENCTHFGCFVDIGVSCNGLIHSSALKGFTFQIGDRVEVKVINVDPKRKRIGLEAINKL